MVSNPLSSPQREPNGWHETIRPGISVQQVTERTASFIVPPSVLYSISQPETVQLAIPVELLTNVSAARAAVGLPADDASPIYGETIVITPNPPSMGA